MMVKAGIIVVAVIPGMPIAWSISRNQCNLNLETLAFERLSIFPGSILSLSLEYQVVAYKANGICVVGMNFFVHTNMRFSSSASLYEYGKYQLINSYVSRWLDGWIRMSRFD